MDCSVDEDQENSLKFIRKLRKKLRQIERLEKDQRELTDEEKIKLSCKHEIRSKLQFILSTINEVNVSVESNKSENDPKQEKEQEAGDFEPPLIQSRNPSDEDVPRTDVDLCVQSKSLAEKVTAQEIDSVKIESREKTTTKAKKVLNTRSTLRRFWCDSAFQVSELIGHNDAINSVCATDNWIVSGSRDTTVKLWDANTGEELKSMGGHTGQVTAIKILPSDDSDSLRQNMDRSTIEELTDIDERHGEDQRIVISGSTDCSIRLWLLPQGLFIKSIYNYNPVSSLDYYKTKKYVIVGSNSGNLTVYNLSSNCQVYSSTIHSSSITQIQFLSSDQIITSSAHGNLKVWKIETEPDGQTKEKKRKPNELNFSISSDDFDISLLYSYEEHEQYLSERHIHCFCMYNGIVYFGDDGTNIKVWNPSTGQLTKLRNHNKNIPGITDGVSVVDDLLLSTSYDMDHGVGSINVRSLHSDCYREYVATFAHGHEIPRLSTLHVQFSKESKFFVTGGEKLLLWRFLGPGKSRSNDEEHHIIFIKGQNVTEISMPPSDSDAPSDDDESSEEEEGKWFWQRSKPKPEKTRQSDDSASAQDSGSDTSDLQRDETTVAKSSNSYWDWCTMI